MDINTLTTRSLSTPLNIAADYLRADVVEMLLLGGADATIKGSFGLTPLDAVKMSSRKGVYGQWRRDEHLGKVEAIIKLLEAPKKMRGRQGLAKSSKQRVTLSWF
jgi:hypothetical protein